MLKYPCLVLDHDDTVVQTMKTMSYPFFLYGLNIFRPGQTISFEDYVRGCHDYGFVDLCRQRYGYTQEELDLEHDMWMEYVLNHTPEPYPGIGSVLHQQKEEGGLICVVSHSREDNILRDYRAHFGFVPDAIYGFERPENQRKPNPYPLLDIMERFHLSADEILVVDDMKLSCKMAAPLGVKVAYSGWNGLNVPEVEKEMTELCDFHFNTVAAFADFLFR